MSASKDVVMCSGEAYHSKALFRGNSIAFSHRLGPLELGTFLFKGGFGNDDDGGDDDTVDYLLFAGIVTCSSAIMFRS